MSPEIIDFSSLASFRRSLEAADTCYGVCLILCLCFVFYIPCKFVPTFFRFLDFMAALSAHLPGSLA